MSARPAQPDARRGGDQRFERARAVADAVLYEGYILYPYRASSQKNRVRWQFGVLNPREHSEAGSSEPWSQQTDVLVEPGRRALLHVKARFLQLQSKRVERTVDGPTGAGFEPVASLDVAGETHITWDEGVEREVESTLRVDDLLAGSRPAHPPDVGVTASGVSETTVPFELPASSEVEELRDASGALLGRVVRERWPVTGQLRLRGEQLPGPYLLARIRLRTENLTPWSDLTVPRDVALRRSLLAAHTLLALEDAEFVSLLEPPEWARPYVAACENVNSWPVLVGEEGRRDLVLSSPIILYDYPAVAPESQGDLFDAAEIDEILTLRTMTLTEEEKREVRATDARAAALLDRVDDTPPEVLDRLHGAIRYLREATSGRRASTPAPAPGLSSDLVDPSRPAPWWDPGMDAGVSPETDSLPIAGVRVSKGSRVVLRPGLRRADAQDLFLAGRTARVEAVFFDVDEEAYLAVTLEDDPAADLHQWHGRFLYFSPDEVEPVPAGEEGPR